jgi:hypothetical protein
MWLIAILIIGTPIYVIVKATKPGGPTSSILIRTA